MTELPTYMFVGRDMPHHMPLVTCTGAPAEIIAVPGVRELFIALNDRNITNLKLLIDISQINMLRSLGIIEVIQTVSTLVDSHRVMKGMKLQSTPLSVSVTPDTDINTLRELVNSNIFCICPYGEGVSPVEQSTSISNWMDGTPYIPPSIKNRLYPPITGRGTEFRLTPRQSQILHLIVARGADNKSLARITNLSMGTVKLHLSALYKKYNVRNRTQLVIAAKNDV